MGDPCDRPLYFHHRSVPAISPSPLVGRGPGGGDCADRHGGRPYRTPRHSSACVPLPMNWGGDRGEDPFLERSFVSLRMKCSPPHWWGGDQGVGTARTGTEAGPPVPRGIPQACVPPPQEMGRGQGRGSVPGAILRFAQDEVHPSPALPHRSRHPRRTRIRRIPLDRDPQHPVERLVIRQVFHPKIELR